MFGVRAVHCRKRSYVPENLRGGKTRLSFRFPRMIYVREETVSGFFQRFYLLR